MIFSKFKKVAISGLTIKIPKDMAWCFNNDQYYEKNLTYWLSYFFKSIQYCRFFDVGANYGFYTVLAASKCKSVTSFEPVAETFKWLQKNVKENSLANVKLNNSGLSNTISTTSINIYSSSGNNSVYDRSIPEGHSLYLQRQEQIKLFDLDSLMKDKEFESPDLMKIDVEGGELNVLLGAQKTISVYQPIIIMEYSDETCRDAGYSTTDLLKLLQFMKYRVFGLAAYVNDNRAHPTESFQEMDIANIIALPNDMKLPNGERM